MANRIYLVKNKNTGVERLIRAVSRVESVRFVARTSLEANAASQEDLVRLVATGVQIEDSKVLLGNDDEDSGQE